MEPIKFEKLLVDNQSLENLYAFFDWSFSISCILQQLDGKSVNLLKRNELYLMPLQTFDKSNFEIQKDSFRFLNSAYFSFWENIIKFEASCFFMHERRDDVQNYQLIQSFPWNLRA